MSDQELIDREIITAITKALDDLVTACEGKNIDKRDVMKARAMLPKWCKNTLEK